MTLFISEIANGDNLSNFKYFLYNTNSTITTNISKIATPILYIKSLVNNIKQFAIYTTIGFVHIFTKITTLISSLSLIPIMKDTVSSIIIVKNKEINKLKIILHSSFSIIISYFLIPTHKATNDIMVTKNKPIGVKIACVYPKNTGTAPMNNANVSNPNAIPLL